MQTPVALPVPIHLGGIIYLHMLCAMHTMCEFVEMKV